VLLLERVMAVGSADADIEGLVDGRAERLDEAVQLDEGVGSLLARDETERLGGMLEEREGPEGEAREEAEGLPVVVEERLEKREREEEGEVERENVLEEEKEVDRVALGDSNPEGVWVEEIDIEGVDAGEEDRRERDAKGELDCEAVEERETVGEMESDGDVENDPELVEQAENDELMEEVAEDERDALESKLEDNSNELEPRKVAENDSEDELDNTLELVAVTVAEAVAVAEDVWELVALAVEEELEVSDTESEFEVESEDVCPLAMSRRPRIKSARAMRATLTDGEESQRILGCARGSVELLYYY
jgi:DNA segregation ATPase FtsK/SpoIIIE, S-DNA-T family